MVTTRFVVFVSRRYRGRQRARAVYYGRGYKKAGFKMFLHSRVSCLYAIWPVDWRRRDPPRAKTRCFECLLGYV